MQSAIEGSGMLIAIRATASCQVLQPPQVCFPCCAVNRAQRPLGSDCCNSLSTADSRWHICLGLPHKVIGDNVDRHCRWPCRNPRVLSGSARKPRSPRSEQARPGLDLHAQTAARARADAADSGYAPDVNADTGLSLARPFVVLHVEDNPVTAGSVACDEPAVGG